MPDLTLLVIELFERWTRESVLVMPMLPLFRTVMASKSARGVVLIAMPRPPLNVMLLLTPTRSESKMVSTRPFEFCGRIVAVGLPKIARSVRPTITTFSVQVPETAMEFGPAAGREASAAPMVVKAPGVAPLQSTVTSAANARPDDRRRTNTQVNKGLGPEEQILVISFPRTSRFEIEKSGRTSPRHVRAAEGVVS